MQTDCVAMLQSYWAYGFLLSIARMSMQGALCDISIPVEGTASWNFS